MHKSNAIMDYRRRAAARVGRAVPDRCGFSQGVSMPLEIRSHRETRFHVDASSIAPANAVQIVAYDLAESLRFLTAGSIAF
jgi:hypothetical protein